MSEVKPELPPLRSHTTDCMNGRTPADGSAVARYRAADIESRRRGGGGGGEGGGGNQFRSYHYNAGHAIVLSFLGNNENLTLRGARMAPKRKTGHTNSKIRSTCALTGFYVMWGGVKKA